MSKGSTQRPGDHKAYSDNYDRIFNRDKREKESGLIELPKWTDALYPKEDDGCDDKNKEGGGSDL